MDGSNNRKLMVVPGTADASESLEPVELFMRNEAGEVVPFESGAAGGASSSEPETTLTIPFLVDNANSAEANLVYRPDAPAEASTGVLMLVLDFPGFDASGNTPNNFWSGRMAGPTEVTVGIRGTCELPERIHSVIANGVIMEFRTEDNKLMTGVGQAIFDGDAGTVYVQGIIPYHARADLNNGLFRMNVFAPVVIVQAPLAT